MSSGARGIIRIATSNVSNLKTKLNGYINYMATHDITVLVMTETWLGTSAGGYQAKPYNANGDWLAHLVPAERSEGQVRGHLGGGLGIVVNPSHVSADQVKVVAESRHWAAWDVERWRVVGVYLPPSLSVQAVRQVLEAIVPVLNTERPLVMTGDFNASLGHRCGRFRDNDRGRLLRTFWGDAGLTLAEPDSDDNAAYQTTVGQRQDTNRWRDLHVLNQAAHVRLRSWEVDKDTAFDTDHYTCVLSLTGNIIRSGDEHKRHMLRWKTSKLHDEEIRTRYREVLNRKMQPVLSEMDTLLATGDWPTTRRDRLELANRLECTFRKAITNTATEVLGRLTPRDKRRQPKESKFDTETVKELEREFNELKRAATATGSMETRQLARDCWSRLNKAYHEAAHHHWHSEFSEKMTAGDVREMVRTLTRIRRSKARSVTPPKPREELDGLADTFYRHFQPCITDENDQQPTPRQRQPGEEYEELDQGDAFDTHGSDLMLAELTPLNLLQRLRYSARGKTPGKDGITRELFALTPGAWTDEIEATERQRVVVRALSALFKVITRLGALPEQWAHAQMVPIYKGKGNRNDYANYRPIALCSYLRKMFEQAMADLIVGEGFHRYQGGFQANRSTLDQVATLHHLTRISKRDHDDKHITMVFLDIRGAYDCVNRNLLWEKAREKRVPERLVRMMAAMLKQGSAEFIADGKCSKTFHLDAGVPQGSAVSPFLYNLVIDNLFRRLETMGLVMGRDLILQPAGGAPVPAAGFADDVVLVARTHEAMRRLLLVCEQYSREMGFRWSAPKSKVITNVEMDEPLRLYGEPLDVVGEFTYLGVPFTCDGIKVEALLNKNLASFTKSCLRLRGLGMNANGFGAYRSILAFKAFCMPCLEYGLAVTPLSRKQMARLDRAVHGELRFILGVGSNTGRDVTFRLTKSESYEVRHAELTTKYVVRTMNNLRAGRMMVSDWLDDALNDDKSTLRALMSNELFQSIWPTRAKYGYQRRRLWTEQQRAAVMFGSQHHRPWEGHPAGTPPAVAYEVGNRLRLQDSKIGNWRQSWWLRKLEASTEQGNNKLLRDLPLMSGHDSMLSLTGALGKPAERLFVHWATGGIPSHRQHQICGHCNEEIELDGTRSHAARCVSEHLGLEEVEDEVPAPKRRFRYSFDNITRTLWNAFKRRTNWYKDDYWVQMALKCLITVWVRVLGRIDNGASAALVETGRAVDGSANNGDPGG